MASWSQKEELGSLLGLRFLVLIYRALGRRLLRLLLIPVSTYFFLTSGSSRRASIQYLEKVSTFNLQGSGRKWHRLWYSWRHFLQYSHALLDKCACWIGDIKLRNLRVHGNDAVHRYVDVGKGVVLLGAHLGNIEILRAVENETKFIRVNALMFTKHNPRFNKILSELNPDSNVRIITTEDPSPDLVVELQACIARGEVVALLADRVVPGSASKAAPIDFLGTPAEFPSGPFVLASLLACPVFLIFCLEESAEEYSVYVEPFAEKIELPRKERATRLQSYLEAYAKRLEFYCSRYPLQWYNFYEFWR